MRVILGLLQQWPPLTAQVPRLFASKRPAVFRPIPPRLLSDRCRLGGWGRTRTAAQAAARIWCDCRARTTAQLVARAKRKFGACEQSQL